jgi:hypothetical protein
MTPLANQIYKQLLRRVRANKPSITYGELAHAISGRTPVHHRSATFHAALGELSETCRAHQLPCLPAIVWRNDIQRPGVGYYRYAHPRSQTDSARVAAWQREHESVLRESRRFPDVLGDGNPHPASRRARSHASRRAPKPSAHAAPF